MQGKRRDSFHPQNIFQTFPLKKTQVHIRTTERSKQSVSQAWERKLVIWRLENPSQRERPISNCIYNRQGTSFVWISVGDNIGLCCCSQAQSQQHCAMRQRFFVTISHIYDLPPDPTTNTNTSWTLLLAWRQWGTCNKWIWLLCAILFKHLIAVWQGHSAFWQLCI